MKKCNFYLLSILCLIFRSSSKCPSNFKTNNNTLIVYSTEPSTYKEAETKCKSIGGNVVQITDQNRSSLRHYFNQEFLQDLANVTVLIRSNAFEHNGYFYDYYKYRTNEALMHEKGNLLKTFVRPSKGNLSSFLLHKRSINEFLNPVDFLFTKDKDMIAPFADHFRRNGWNLTLKLFGGNASNTSTIKLHNYYASSASDGGFTSRLSLTPIIGHDYWKKIKSWTPFVNLPDVSVFIGAKSNANQTNWFWTNGTMINNSLFPAAETSACQQMTWPLTYDDGINLYPKDCQSGKSHYVCRTSFSAYLKKVSCNASSLNLSWNNKFGKIFEGTKNVKSIIQVNLSSGTFKFSRKFSLSFNQSNVILTNLIQRTTYHAEIVYEVPQCASFIFSTKTSGRTGFGIPEPVQLAHVNDSLSHCAIFWEHNSSHSEIESYWIHIDNGSEDFYLTSFANTYETIGFDGVKSFSMVVDLCNFDYNLTFHFHIQAVSKCDKKSENIQANGTCTTKPSYCNQHTNLLYIIMAGSVAAAVLIIGLTIVLVCYFRRNKVSLKSEIRLHSNNTSNSTAARKQGKDHKDTSICENASNKTFHPLKTAQHLQGNQKPFSNAACYDDENIYEAMYSN